MLQVRQVVARVQAGRRHGASKFEQSEQPPAVERSLVVEVQER
jgi:hypothetical protein